MQKKTFETEVGGKKLVVELSNLADQTNGSALVRYGNTIVLATAVMSAHAREAIDFFPLVVDYEEKFYATGKILGGRFQKREGRPSDEAILSGRIVDRTIRPLFPQHIRNEVQVVITVLSIEEDDPDWLAVVAASVAVGVSNIPWNGPVGAVRIGKQIGSDELTINPTYASRDEKTTELDVICCGREGTINMIEVGSKEVSNEIVGKALDKATEEIGKLEAFQKQIIKEAGKIKQVLPEPEFPKGIAELFAETVGPKFKTSIFTGKPGKESIHAIEDEWMTIYKEKLPDTPTDWAARYFNEKVNELLHKEAIENETRPDGRTLTEVRPLYAEAGGISPVLHGSGVFFRGGTHILSALTLGGPKDSQLVDTMEEQSEKRFMHHYNFPPFSVGETGRMGGMNRRMIGHGALAERALVPVIPPKEIFPYTIRLVSEAMASNGSTSMGSVCGSTLALMDGGVPIKAPVAGIAMGLMMDGSKYKILTDIQGPEDHHGDMDFKVAGTRNGITAIQLDIKLAGVPVPILKEALAGAEKARHHILDVIEQAIPAPRLDISPNAPKILALKIKTDQIGLVIGPGGKTVKGIREMTGAEIDIEDDGTVFITGKNGAAEAAMKIVEEMTHEHKKGDKTIGEVVKTTDFGAFVRLPGGTEGLVHVSEIASFRIDRVEAYLKLGDKVPIVVKDIDERGRLSLSIKLANPDFIKKKAEPPKNPPPAPAKPQ